MGKWSREFRSQLFGGGRKKSRSYTGSKNYRQRSSRDRSFVKTQYNAARDHARNINKRRR